MEDGEGEVGGGGRGEGFEKAVLTHTKAGCDDCEQEQTKRAARDKKDQFLTGLWRRLIFVGWRLSEGVTFGVR